MKTKRHYLKCPSPRPPRRIYEYTPEDNARLSDIVIHIINGLDIQKVDPQLYPDLIPILQEKEKALKEWRNQPASRSIKTALSYVQSYRYENDPIQQLSTNSRSTLPVSGSKISQGDLDYYIDLCLNRGEFNQIEPRFYKVLLTEIKKIQSEALLQGDYYRAQDAEATARRLIAMDSENRYNEIISSKVNDLNNKVSEKSEEFEFLQENWDTRIKEAEKRRDAQILAIEKEKDHKLREFDKTREKGPSKKDFALISKPSSQLLILENTEKMMVSSKRYTEAQTIRAEARKLKAKELKEARERWEHDMDLKRAEIQQKLEEKAYVRKTNANLEIEKLKRKAETEIDQEHKALKHLEHHWDMALSMQQFGTSTQTRALNSSHSINSNTSKPTIMSNQAEFRRKALINTIVYSKAITPRRAQTIQ